MTTSAEVRWFFKGIVNNDILTFFKEKQIVFKEEQPRTDWYLMNIDRFTSIKLRNGNIEVKKFINGNEKFQINPEVSGVAERWVKFSFGINPNGDSGKVTNGKSQQWIQVDKSRATAKYQISGEGRVEPVLTQEQLPEVCTLEICFIKTQKLDFWTVCFEASGPEDKVESNLETVTRHIFAGASQPTLLRTENSYGYPQFLAKLSLLY